MIYSRLGASGLKVSQVALGNWLTQGRTLDAQATQAIVNRAYELGINFFDTADIYNIGEAEKALGKAIKEIRRESLVIATKCFWPMSEDPNDRGLSRKHIFESVHNSLKRLGTDYVDLMQCHRYDPETPVEETVRALDDLCRQGKILYWGVSMWKGHEITDAAHVARSINAQPPISNQPVYHMLNRGIEASVIPASEEQGISQIVFSPLAQGVLTGKYLPGQSAPEGSRGADEKSNSFMKDLMNYETLERVQRLKSFAELHGCTVGQFALSWCLRNPNVTSVIVGASTVSHIEENVGAVEFDFDSSIYDEAEAIIEGRSVSEFV